MTDHSPDIDRVFQAMSHYRSRLVVYYFIREDDEAAIDDLITQLAAWERKMGTDASDDHERRIALDLRHAHLPELADAGLIEYDPDDRMIRYHGSPLFEDSIHITQLMAREVGDI